MPLLFNPSTYDPKSFDADTRAQLLALVDFFETKGLARNKEEYYSGEWYTDFLKLIADRKIFATFGTPAEVGALVGDDKARWDLARINELNEILGFYSLAHWYAWQVSVLGLGPVWLSARAGPQTGGHPARRGQHLRVRPVRARARRRHLFLGHDPDPHRGRLQRHWR